MRSSRLSTTVGLVALIATCASGVFAEERSGPQFKWQTIAGSKEPYMIQGDLYEPESADHEWNILRATNTSGDVTRFELRQADRWIEDRDSGENTERTELDGYRRKWDDKTPVWGAYSFFIEPGVVYRSNWTAIAQMHGTKIRSFHVHFTNDVLTIYSEQLSKAGPVVTVRYVRRIQRNAWHNVVFHLIQGASDSGRLEYWLDGKKIVDFAGAIGAEENNAYWKFGIYRGYGPIGTPFAIQYANMEVGTTDLTARIANPQSIPSTRPFTN
jgi:hypothetical protein